MVSIAVMVDPWMRNVETRNLAVLSSGCQTAERSGGIYVELDSDVNDVAPTGEEVTTLMTANPSGLQE
jgi:hypothetical protein